MKPGNLEDKNSVELFGRAQKILNFEQVYEDSGKSGFKFRI